MKLHIRARSVGLLALALVALSAVFAPQAFAQDALIEFAGIVEAQDATSLTVNGVVFDISQARVEAGIGVGSTVRIEGRLTNGVFVASEVQTANPGVLPGEVELTGVVDSIDGSLITVAGRTLSLTGAEVDSNITAGQRVRVHLSPAGENLWTVREVRLANRFDDDDSGRRPDRFRLVGTLEEVGQGYIVVSGERIEVTDARVDGLLILGSQVRVDFIPQNGEWSANRISSRFDDDDFDDFDDDSSGRRGGVTLPVPPDCVAGAPAGWTTYTIQPGDTLSGLALRTGAMTEQLISANCITNPRGVAAGTVLAVPRTPDPQIIIRGDDRSGWRDDDPSISGNRGALPSQGGDFGSISRRDRDDSSGSRSGGRDHSSGRDDSSGSSS